MQTTLRMNKLTSAWVQEEELFQDIYSQVPLGTNCVPQTHCRTMIHLVPSECHATYFSKITRFEATLNASRNGDAPELPMRILLMITMLQNFYSRAQCLYTPLSSLLHYNPWFCISDYCKRPSSDRWLYCGFFFRPWLQLDYPNQPIM